MGCRVLRMQRIRVPPKSIYSFFFIKNLTSSIRTVDMSIRPLRGSLYEFSSINMRVMLSLSNLRMVGYVWQPAQGCWLLKILPCYHTSTFSNNQRPLTNYLVHNATNVQNGILSIPIKVKEHYQFSHTLVGEKKGHIGHYQSADFLCIIVLCLVPSFFFPFSNPQFGWLWR